MKITVLVYGSRGDVEPYVALGAGLQRAGHDVSVAADPCFEPLVRQAGLRLVPVAANPLEVFESEAGQVVADSEAGALKRLSAYGKFNAEMKGHIARNLETSWTACQGAEALLFSINAFAGYHIAEALKVPAFAGSIAPFTRTRQVPSINFAPKPALGAAYNLLSHRLTERIFFMPPASKEINRWRQETLKLAPLPGSGFIRRFLTSDAVPMLYSFSPELMPKPEDWPAWIHVPGYWFPESDPSWTPPAELTAFLAAGPAPVFVGFGSMASRAGGRELRAKLPAVFQALERAGQRGIVSAEPGAATDIVFPASVMRVGALPHDWLFPRVSMTVHHGGSGTTSQSLRAGVPMLITPFMWDQPFWGRRVHEMGFGPAPIPFNRLTADNLADAIQRTVGDVAMRERARAAGGRVRAERGVERAVAIINERLGRRDRP